jgi:hypothetical protein
MKTPAKSETLYIFDEREPVWKSAMRDTISFGWLIGCALALNTLMPPSAWLNASLGIVWILWLVGKGLKRRMTKTPAEAMAWLRAEYPTVANGETPTPNPEDHPQGGNHG